MKLPPFSLVFREWFKERELVGAHAFLPRVTMGNRAVSGSRQMRVQPLRFGAQVLR